MATVEEGLQSQIRNIEAAYGRSIDEWIDLIAASGLQRHGQIVAWLKSEHGLSHGAANRVALVALSAAAPSPPDDPVAALYADRSTSVRAIHDRIWAIVDHLGDLSLRRRTQFAMIKPAAKHVDLGLILPGEPVTDRLESAATFNALFTHRVRVRSEAEVDDALAGWIYAAYDRAS
jgi:hypothetical protein